MLLDRAQGHRRNEEWGKGGPCPALPNEEQNLAKKASGLFCRKKKKNVWENLLEDAVLLANSFG